MNFNLQSWMRNLNAKLLSQFGFGLRIQQIDTPHLNEVRPDSPAAGWRTPCAILPRGWSAHARCRDFQEGH